MTRGTCEVGPDGHLVQRLVERRGVARRADGTFDVGDGLEPSRLPGDTPVSMNLWGFQSSIWPVLEAAVLRAHPSVSPGRAPCPIRPSSRRSHVEVLLPEVVGDMIAGRTGGGGTVQRRRARPRRRRAVASGSPTPMTSPSSATSSPSWWPRDCAPKWPLGPRGLDAPAPLAAPPPTPENRGAGTDAPPRPCSYQAPARTGPPPTGSGCRTVRPSRRVDGAPSRPRGYRLEVGEDGRADSSGPTRPGLRHARRHLGPAAPPRQRARRRRRRPHSCLPDRGLAGLRGAGRHGRRVPRPRPGDAHPRRSRGPVGGLEDQPPPAVHGAHLRLRRPRGRVASRQPVHR